MRWIRFATLALLSGCQAEVPGPASPDAPPDLAARSETAVYVREENGIVRTVRGRFATSGGDPVGAALDFVRTFRDHFGLQDVERDLYALPPIDKANGGWVVAFERLVDGYPVYGAQLRVQLDADGFVTYVSAHVPSEVAVPAPPTIPRELAEAIGGAPDREVVESELLAYADEIVTGEPGPTRLAWKVTAIGGDQGGIAVRFVDAHSAELLAEHDGIEYGRNRVTYESSDGFWVALVDGFTDYFGWSHRFATRMIEEDGVLPDQTPHPETLRAHALMGDVYDYFLSTFGRDGPDGRGSSIVSFTRYGPFENSAFHFVLRAFFLGPGMIEPDVVTHEYVHALIFYGPRLIQEGEPRELNESLADTFAAFFTTGADAAWTLGESTPVGVIRDLRDPTTRGHPRHLDQHRRGSDAHIGSNVPSHAAYLAVEGGQHADSGIDVRGMGVPAAEQIYFLAMTEYMTPSTRFSDAREALATAARELTHAGRSGVSLRDCASILDAYAAVGIGAVDSDRDCWDDDTDNCPLVFNPDQEPVDCLAESPDPVCSEQGAPCGGSGPAFDEDCCAPLICVVGACQPAVGGRERVQCEDETECAAGLRCGSVGGAESPPTCCARDGDYCTADDDCCGLMRCADNRCAARDCCETCLVGDCGGAAFCDVGLCRHGACGTC